MRPSEQMLPRDVFATREVLPFRSVLRSSVVDKSTITVADLGGESWSDVKISEYRLERYLNPSNPSCSG